MPLATVIMGAGHPYFNDAGQRVEPQDDKAFRFTGGRETWDRLVAGETDYRLIESRDDFEALASGDLDLGDKTKLLGTAEVGSTLQFSRPGVGLGDRIQNVPALGTMTLGALNVLDKNDEGFFLMVEGGAVDWAAHANNLPRLIEEQVEFNEAVEVVVDWVEANSNWDETLVIVTTDHGNGLLQGPGSDRELYQPIISQGAGAMPLVRWNSDTHTRELVPVYAKGPGASYFSEHTQPADMLSIYNVPAEQQVYGDNTDVFHATMNAFGLTADGEAKGTTTAAIAN